MTDLEYALARIAGALRGGGRGFALVGGLAVSVRATPRMTRDADLVAEADEQDWNCAQIAVSLITARGFDRERDLQASLALLRTQGAF